MPCPPPAEASPSRPRRAGAAGLLLLAALGCASGDAPWDVRRGDEARFRRADRECRLLTADAAGNAGPISFDDCMDRRGFERMGPIERLWKG